MMALRDLGLHSYQKSDLQTVSVLFQARSSNRPPTQTFRGLPGWLEGIPLGCIYGSSGAWDSCLQGICVVAKKVSRCKVRR
jgi:hypothetical protein